MKTSALAGWVLASLALIAAPLAAQAVSGEVVVRGGPVTGRVAVGDEYSSYDPHYRRVVVVERYAPRAIRVERFRHHKGKHWKRKGYREVVVYYVDGRYYDGYHPGFRGLREVIVYEHDGRFYRDYGDHGHGRYRYHNERDD